MIENTTIQLRAAPQRCIHLRKLGCDDIGPNPSDIPSWSGEVSASFHTARTCASCFAAVPCLPEQFGKEAGKWILRLSYVVVQGRLLLQTFGFQQALNPKLLLLGRLWVTPEEVATSARLGKLRPGENPVWKGGGSFRRKRARMFKALCDTCLRGLLAWCMIPFLAIPKKCRSCFASGVISLQNSRVLRVRTSYQKPYSNQEPYNRM